MNKLILILLGALFVLGLIIFVLYGFGVFDPPAGPSADQSGPQTDSGNTKYFILADNTFYTSIASDNNEMTSLVQKPAPNFATNPELYSWTLSSNVEFAMKNKKPVTITIKQIDGIHKVLSNASGYPVMLGEIDSPTPKGLFLIVQSSDKSYYNILGTDSNSTITDGLYWVIGSYNEIAFGNKEDAIFFKFEKVAS
jgi:hypothetical protein